jgi:alkyl sulfatase BDS1-like metallo-beta-lactamase superfamily hydrolase
MDLYYKNRGKKPVAVIYTHSHVDHYGGVRGVIDEADVKAGKVKIYAPSGFMEAAAENIMAGNVMSRRASYMYGNLLKPDAKGRWAPGWDHHLAGTVTLIAPTNIMRRTAERSYRRPDLRLYAGAGLEAPSEMLWYIEEKKLIESAEDVTHTLHNTYSCAARKFVNAAVVEIYQRGDCTLGR